MTDVYSDEYWSAQFTITQDDIRRIVECMEGEQLPQDLKTMALRIIRGRLEHGHDISPSALSKITGKSSVQLWNPEGVWQIGDLVLVARCCGKNSSYEAFLGEIISLDLEHATIRLEELSITTKYARLLPGTKNTKKYSDSADLWRNTVLETVEKKLQSGDLDQQSEGILLSQGIHVLNLLNEILKEDPHFVGLEGKWYLVDKIPRIEAELLKSAHHKLLQQPSFSLDDILLLVKTDDATDEILLKMSIQIALRQLPQRFENMNMLGRQQWKALLPTLEEAKVLYYAYDPQTYEVLCQPGQQLDLTKASRLEEIGVYRHLVTFTEWA